MLLNSYANLIWFVCVVLFLYWGWIGNLLIGFDLFLRYFRVKKPNSHFASYDPCSLKGMFFLHPLQIMFHGREGHFLKRRNISFYVKQQRKGWTTLFSILNVIDEYFLQFLWTECHHQKLDCANSFFFVKIKIQVKNNQLRNNEGKMTTRQQLEQIQDKSRPTCKPIFTINILSQHT